MFRVAGSGIEILFKSFIDKISGEPLVYEFLSKKVSMSDIILIPSTVFS